MAEKKGTTTQTQEKKPQGLKLNVGILICHSPADKPDALQKFVEKIRGPVDDAIEETTGVRWVFNVGVPIALEDGTARQVTDFLDPAVNMLADNKLDMVIVVTDVPLAGQDRAMVFGSHSKTARIAAMSTRKLLEGKDGEEKRTLESKSVIENGAVLVLHLMGHMIGIVHQYYKGHVMAPFRFMDPRPPLRFGEKVGAKFKKKARLLPDQKVEVAGALMSFIFHMASMFRHPMHVLAPVLRGRAFRIPLAMPGMTTAALVPTLVLVFTAEIWDVGFHMSSIVAVLFAIATVILGAVYMGLVQNVFFPRKEKETLTEHAAVLNMVVYFSLVEALIGLFVVVGLFVWILEVYVFPPTLMAKWTALEGQDPSPVTIVERLRLAVFISTLATMTAVMAAGLDRREVVRHFSLFSDRP
jgi:hypothetical protein